MADVSVVRTGNLIHAKYRGTMTMDLVREGERKIEALIEVAGNARVLYDTLDMDPPSMDLALEMKAFDGRIRNRVVRSATVVRDAMTAFLSKVAFALSRNHKVFYDDLQRAVEWLKAEEERVGRAGATFE